MDDLTRINRKIAQYWLGTLTAAQESYLADAQVCLGQLGLSAADLVNALRALKQRRDDPARTANLNCHYLNFARLAARDALAGKTEMLVRLGINVEQAILLGTLSDEDISRLAFGWVGPLIRVMLPALKAGAALHPRAARAHAIALVAPISETPKPHDVHPRRRNSP